MDIKQTAEERLVIIKKDKESKIANQSTTISQILLEEFKHWATIDPLIEDPSVGLETRSGFTDLQQKVFKIKKTKTYDISEAIKLIVDTAHTIGYKTFGDDNEYVPYIIIAYEEDDINRIINTETIVPNPILPTDLFQKIANRVADEEEQPIVLFAAQILKIVNSGVCNQIYITIPLEKGILFAAKYQPVLESYGFKLVQTFDGYKILYPNAEIYELPCQLNFLNVETAVKLLRSK